MTGFRLPFDNLGPNRDSHNERIKLFALGLNAVGIAALIGGFFGPLFDPSRPFSPQTAGAGVSIWLICLVAAFELLGYIKGKD
jgi:hypothetical protein